MPDEEDGYRILVDRALAQKISKERAALNEWAKDAPSTVIRKEFGHQAENGLVQKYIYN